MLKKAENRAYRQKKGNAMRVNIPARLILLGIAVVYAAFMGLDLFWPDAVTAISVLKYVSMVLCMALVVSSRSLWQKRDAGLVLIALVFTLAADMFLLFTSHFVIGVCVFCGAHLTYLLRYCRKVFVPAVVLTGGILALVGAAALFGATQVLLYIVGGLYAVLILGVTVTAFTSSLPRTNGRLASAGMVLFLLCDVNVLLFNTLSADTALYSAARVLMWFFYLPSQVLLALSCYDWHSEKIRNNAK